jgi:hypothetical protein
MGRSFLVIFFPWRIEVSLWEEKILEMRQNGNDLSL